MSNLDEMLHLRSNLEKWGQITIKRWQENLDKQGIGSSGELAKSFQQKVQGSQANVLGIALKFKMYGRYRDMSVHKGVKAFERNQNDANRIGATRDGANVHYSNSPKKRWYNKPKMAQIHRMREILGIDMGQAMSDQLGQIAGEISNTTIDY